jgi:DNA-binding CsgD family transcriptional regulator
MAAACREAGLPSPALEEIGTHFRVVLSAVPTGPVQLDERDRAILQLLEDGRGRSTAEIAKAISLSVRATRTRLADLVRRGFVIDVGSGLQDPRRRYFRSAP